jgi:hypothetical protein
VVELTREGTHVGLQASNGLGGNEVVNDGCSVVRARDDVPLARASRRKVAPHQRLEYLRDLRHQTGFVGGLTCQRTWCAPR